MVKKGEKREVTWTPNPDGCPLFGKKYKFEPKYGKKMGKSITLAMLTEDYMRVKDRAKEEDRSVQDFIRAAIAYALKHPEVTEEG